MRFLRAKIEDAQMLFDWRNDELTRSASLSSSPLTMESHLVWLQRVFLDPNREIYISFFDKKAIGTIRRDLKGSLWVLSWTVNPQFRGMGYGKKMLLEFVEKFPANYVAEVKADNVISKKMAESAGFILKSESSGLQLWVRSSDNKFETR
jgi:RimJ/RimL family protein N-acetyltransferase